MKSRQVYEENGLRGYVLVLDKGDEAFEQLTGFARENDITGASLTGIGACRSATLGYFDPAERKYHSTRFEEQLELLSLVGDIAIKDDKPVLHAHLVLGRKDSSAIGGHLQQLEVFPTMEVLLTEVPSHLRKRVDPETGLALISLDEPTGD